jgi:hypothetical protein
MGVFLYFDVYNCKCTYMCKSISGANLKVNKVTKNSKKITSIFHLFQQRINLFSLMIEKLSIFQQIVIIKYKNK